MTNELGSVSFQYQILESFECNSHTFWIHLIVVGYVVLLSGSMNRVKIIYARIKAQNNLLFRTDFAALHHLSYIMEHALH